MIVADILYKLYGLEIKQLRKLIIKLIKRMERGEVYSQTLRRIFKDYYDVEIGMYTHGGCFIPGQISPQTTIGRYCSLARALRIINRNHPLEMKSMHAFFFNPYFKYCNQDNLEFVPLKIGNDVWIGHNAIIVPNVKSIGDGAVIAAGAVVNKDIPPYAVAVGNPARVVRYRFSKEKIEELLAERWWDKPIDDLKSEIKEFFQPIENTDVNK